MSVGVLERRVTQSGPEPTSGGVAARRAMIRWAWRLFRREWRQQLIILLLVVVAVAAVVVGSAVAVNTPPPANAGFGSAQDLATFNVSSPMSKSGSQSLSSVQAQIAALQRRYGTVQVIENETINLPGSTQTYQLRSQDPHGPFGGPMLQLLSGHYPTAADQVAVTPGLASELNLHVGDTWPTGGKTVVGIVQNPQSLLDEFALVPPGQVTNPTTVSVLFDAPGVDPHRIGSNVTTPAQNGNSNAINPETIVLAVATVGMLLIALVAIGGFTVLAQRRMRALGMLESMGATDRNVRLVIRANGVIVGFVGALVGFALGLVAWLAYRPHNEQSAHHLISTFALPWAVIVVAMVLAVVATLFAADRPARAVTRVPVVSALAGRPAPPRPIHRSFVPGLIALVIGFFFFSATGTQHGSGSIDFVIPGFVALIVGIILVSPFFLALLARVGRKAPIAVRLALRDLSRYRARSGSALSAISVGVLIAVVICAVAVARYSNVFDAVGPNLASNELAVWSPSGENAPFGQGGPGPGPGGGRQAIQAPQATPATPATPSIQSQEATVHSIASSIGATHIVQLDTSSANLQNPSANGRQWSGAIYVATPALLRAYGINPSSIPSNVDVLTSRAGLSGSGVQLVYGDLGGKGGGSLVGPGAIGPGGGAGPPGPGNTNPCPRGSCLAHPVVQEESQLPTGTSAPNTLITESALHGLHLTGESSLDGWLLTTSSPITSAQVANARGAAASNNLSLESRNDAPSSHEIVNWATVFGIALALGVLAMSVGLIRSETASELRTLTAAGASSRTRRSLTAVTAGGLAFLGALLGTVAAYVGLAGYYRGNTLEGGLSDLTNVPWSNLFLIVIAMPVAAAVIGWVLAGREPPGIATRPLE
jgi:putative ABC transport system permease protein